MAVAVMMRRKEYEIKVSKDELRKRIFGSLCIISFSFVVELATGNAGI